MPVMIGNTIKRVSGSGVIAPPVGFSLELTFDDIANASGMIGGDATSLADWNLAFGSPASPFTGITVVGNIVTLTGGANITVPDSLFSTDWDDYGHLISIIDTGCIVAAGYNSFGDFDIDSNGTILETIDLPACITMAESCYGCWLLTTVSLPLCTTAGNNCFNGCWQLTTISLPLLTTAGDGCFYACTALTTISLPLCTTAGNNCFQSCTALTSVSLPALSAANTSLGGTSGDDNVFLNISGQTITLTVPVYFQTNNGGSPDGDIVYLAANNIETIVYV